eukprot:480872_1
MIKEHSRPPSLFERILPIIGVLCAICVMFVVVVVICISVSAQHASSYDANTFTKRPQDFQQKVGSDRRQAKNAGNPIGVEIKSQQSRGIPRAQPSAPRHSKPSSKTAVAQTLGPESISMTLYSGSGILVKGFPGGSARFLQISADWCAEPELPESQQCSDVTKENEFFRSEEELFFHEKIERWVSMKQKIGLWVCGPALGNKPVFWRVTAVDIVKTPPTLKRSIYGKTKLTLTDIPEHSGQVSLTADTYTVLLKPDGNGREDLVAEKPSDHGRWSEAGLNFDMLSSFAYPGSQIKIFASSQWDGPVEFPILVKVVY